MTVPSVCVLLVRLEHEVDFSLVVSVLDFVSSHDAFFIMKSSPGVSPAVFFSLFSPVFSHCFPKFTSLSSLWGQTLSSSFSCWAMSLYAPFIAVSFMEISKAVWIFSFIVSKALLKIWTASSFCCCVSLSVRLIRFSSWNVTSLIV